MIAVIFEAVPRAGRAEDYLALAAALRADVERADGFLSIERFASLSDERKILSLSFWRDEEAVAAWRGSSAHRSAQAAGHEHIFDRYNIRIANILRERDFTREEK